MADAAAEGLIDFSKARLRDPKWQRRSQILLDALSRKKQQQAGTARLMYYTGLVANGKLTEKSFEEIQLLTQEAYYDLVGSIQPWLGRSGRDRKSHEFQEARQAYIDAFGVDPHDPGFKAWEAEQIAKFQAEEAARQAEGESEEEKLHKRLRARKTRKRGQRQGGRRG